MCRQGKSWGFQSAYISCQGFGIVGRRLIVEFLTSIGSAWSPYRLGSVQLWWTGATHDAFVLDFPGVGPRTNRTVFVLSGGNLLTNA